MREHEQAGDAHEARADVDALGGVGPFDACLDKPQGRGPDGGADKRDGGEPHDRVRLGRHTQQDESPLEEPTEALVASVEEQVCREHEEDDAVGAVGPCSR